MDTGEASTHEKTSKNSAKQCKTAFLLASEPITVTEGRRGNVRMGMKKKKKKKKIVPKRF